MSAFLTLLVLAAAPFRAADVNPTPRGPANSNPQRFAAAGPVAFFWADDGVNGVELWRTDGTDAGTYLVRDVRPGVSGSTSPEAIAVIDAGTVAFRDSQRLYVSDGTAAGTRRVCCGSLTVQRFLVLPDGQILIAASNGSATRLYLADGSDEGASLVAGVNPTEFLGVVGSRAVFFSTSPSALWASDGTAAGTESLLPLSGSNSRLVTVASGTYTWGFSGGQTVLVRTDGTPAGTVSFGPFSGGTVQGRLTASQDRLIFPGFTAATGSELFTWGGDAGDFPLFSDIRDGGSASPTSVTGFQGGALCLANDGNNGPEPWFADSAGTPVQLAEIATGTFGLTIPEFVPSSGRAVFAANGGSVTQPIWVTDGTPAGTVPLTTPVTGAAASQVAAFGSGWLFLYLPGPGSANDPWFTDGTPAGTRLVRSISQRSTLSSFPNAFGSVGERLVFIAEHPVDGYEFVAYDVHDGGVVSLGDLYPGPFAGGGWGVLGELNGRLLVAAQAPATGIELYSTAGQSGDLTLVKDIWPGPESGDPGFFDLGVGQYFGVVAGGKLYFRAFDPIAEAELWETDGTPAGTKMIVDHYPFGNGIPQYEHLMTPLPDGGLVLVARDVNGDPDFYRVTADGGFVLLSETWPTSIARVADELFIDLSDLGGPAGWELWVTDGTPAGTRLYADVVPGPSGSAPESLTEQGGRLFFYGREGTTSEALYAVVPPSTAVTKLLTIGPQTGPQTIDYSNLTAGPNGVYFWLDTPDAGREPYFADTDGARMLGDLVPGRDSSDPAEFTLAGGRIWFVASSDVHGRELWTSDGTVAGTREVADLVPGAGGSDPKRLFPAYGWLFFNANDALADEEVWALPLTEGPPSITAQLTGQTGGDGGWFVSDVGVTFTVTDPVVPILSSSACGTSRVDIDGGFVGSTVVTQDGPDTQLSCSATTSGGTSNVTVSVRRDATAPRVTCPPTVVARATSVSGTVVTFAAPVAVDQIDPAPQVTLSRASGSMFPLGRTLVTATATDHVGHTSECGFEVDVRDGTAPVLTCPEAEQAAQAGVPFEYAASATDDADPLPMLAFSAPSGTVFPAGRSAVTVTAVDAAGNLASCVFFVNVEAAADAGGGGGGVNGSCGCDGSGGLGLFALLVLVRRRRR